MRRRDLGSRYFFNSVVFLRRDLDQAIQLIRVSSIKLELLFVTVDVSFLYFPGVPEESRIGGLKSPAIPFAST